MKLSQAFPGQKITKDADFTMLGRTSTAVTGSLAFADSHPFLVEAQANSSVVAIVTTEAAYAEAKCTKPAVFVDNARSAFYALQNRLVSDAGFFPKLKKKWASGVRIHSSAVVHENTEIGEGVMIHERAVVLENSVIGAGTEIHAGAVIGADGILHYSEGGRLIPVKHAGYSVVGAHCTVLANAVVTKGILPDTPTTVGDGSLVGISSTVGHEAVLGKRCVVSGNSVVARLANIGDDAWLGTGCTIREHVKIGAKARIAAGSVVVEDVDAGASVAGNFAVPQNIFFKLFLRMKGGKL